jgi:hypothetical protein
MGLKKVLLWGKGFSSVAEHVLSMCEALRSIPSTTKDKKQTKHKEHH